MKISNIVLVGIIIIVLFFVISWKLTNISFELIISLLALFILYWALWINESTKEIAEEANIIAKRANLLNEQNIKEQSRIHEENIDRENIEKYWIQASWKRNFDTLCYLDNQKNIVMYSSVSHLSKDIKIWWEIIKYRNLLDRLHQIKKAWFVDKSDMSLEYMSSNITNTWKQFC